MSQIKMMAGLVGTLGLLVLPPPLLGESAEAIGLARQDVTAAVRADGDKRTVSVNGISRTGFEIEKAFDGKASVQGDSLLLNYVQGSDTTVKSAYATGGVALEYAIDATFEPGKDVVIDGYSILTGKGFTHGLYRMPSTWKFQGFDESENDWVTLDERTAYVGWGEDISYDGTPQLGTRFRFANARAYRRYRFLIMSSYWQTTGYWSEAEAEISNRGALQISEIQLFGYVGAGIDGKAGTGLLDLTEAVREVGDACRRVNSNLTLQESLGILDHLVDGQPGTRIFANYETSVKPAYEAGGAWVEYAFDEAFAPGADIVATGYSILCSTNSGFSHVLKRMPCDWKFQGYSETANDWVTLDAYHDFTCWETVDCAGTPCLGFRFDFPNSATFRRYRLLISRQYWGRAGIDPVHANYGALQLSELQIFGYLGKGIAGTVEQGASERERPLKLKAWATVADVDGGNTYSPPFQPTVSNSTASVFDGAPLEALIDGLRHSRFLCTPELPFDVYYEIPTNMFLVGKDVVLTNYVLEVDTAFANYAARLPKSWRLEAFVDGRWVALDKRTSGGGSWTEEPFTYGALNHVAYTATFEIPAERRFAATRYRLRVRSLAGATDFQLCEMTLNGVWGTAIANPPPARTGTLLIVR